MTAAADPRVRTECVRTLYRQAPASFVAAMVVIVYMAVTTAPYTSAPVLSAWLAVQAAVQLLRFAVLYAYRRAGLTEANAGRWANAYTAYMFAAGLVWGSCAFLFIHTASPISLALTLCGLYGISGGSVPANAYNPPGSYLFIGAIFVAVLLRMLLIADVGHIALGVASLCFALIMVMFTKVQHRSVSEGFLIRFENAELLERLRIEKAGADEARLKAEQASLAKSQFLAAASHDLRQPLYALSLFSSTLQTLRLGKGAKEIVARIHTNIAALESLFNALLDISKLDAGVVKPQLAAVGLSDIFMRLEQYFEADARQRGVSLRFSSSRHFVRSDPALLERILVNLISNALRYAPEGSVLVGCRKSGADRLLIEVWDTGLGIAPADRERIFQDFVQVGNPERDRRKGLGLGLAIAQRTAELLDTRISLASWPGQGSVFRFAAPLAEPSAHALPMPTGPSLDVIAGLRVLIIDDEESIRDGLRMLLQQWGAQVDTAGGIAEALSLLESGRRYRVVLTDYRLREDLTGFDAIEAIARLQSPAPACCLVTGDINAGVLAEARQRDLPLLHKPVQPAKLRAVLNFLAAS